MRKGEVSPAKRLLEVWDSVQRLCLPELTSFSPPPPPIPRNVVTLSSQKGQLGDRKLSYGTGHGEEGSPGFSQDRKCE